MSVDPIIIKAGIDSSRMEQDLRVMKERIKKFQQEAETHDYRQDALKKISQTPGAAGQYAKSAYDKGEIEHRKSQQQEREKYQAEFINASKGMESIRAKLDLLDKEDAKVKGLTASYERLKNAQTEAAVLLSKTDPNGPNRPNDPGGPSGPGGIIQKIVEKMDYRKIAGLAAGAVAVLSTVASYSQHRTTRDREMARANASVMQGSNVAFQSTMAGRGYENYYEAAERSRAFEKALSERSGQESTDKWKTAAKLGSSIVTGAGAGALAAGPWGALAGAGFGAGKTLLGDKGVYNQMFDRPAYEAGLTRDMIKNFQGNVEAERLMNPQKFTASKLFGEGAGAFQGVQRAIGMDDRSFYGAPLMKAEQRRLNTEMGAPSISRYRTGDPARLHPEKDESIEDYNKRVRHSELYNSNRPMGWLAEQQLDSSGKSSFSKERIVQNLQQILQSGGNTQFARRGGASMAAEYQRAGMTGAAGELGALSGFGGNVAQTEDKYVRMMSEAMKIGIDKSTMPEEFRQFTAAATSLFMQTGGAAGAVSVLGQGMVGSGAVSIQAAQGAYQVQNQESGQSTGARGAMKWAYLRSEEGKDAFSGASEESLDWITTANISNLDPNHIMVKKIAQETGMSRTEVLEEIRTVQQKGQNLTQGADTAGEKYRKGLESYISSNSKSGKGRAELAKAYLETEEGISLGGSAFGKAAVEREEAYSQQTGPQAVAGLNIQTGTLDLSVPKTRRGQLRQGPDTAADAAEGSLAGDQTGQMAVIATSLQELKKSMDLNIEESVTSKAALARNSTVIEALTSVLKSGASDETLNKLMQSLRVNLGGQQPAVKPNGVEK